MNEIKFKANIKDVLALQSEVEAIPEIPTPVNTDEGKVLTVAVDSSGETPVVSYELETPSGGLPAISAGDAGKVLTVNAGETAAEWSAVPAELPAIGASDSGKLLAVNSGHTAAEWIAPPLVVPLEWNDLETEVSFTKTAGEVIDALLAGRMVQVYDAYGTASSGSMTGYLLKNASWSVGSYSFTLAAPVAIDSNDLIVLTCSTADGYPTATLE